MVMTTFVLQNIEETTTLGQKLGALLKSGDCIVLTGELGTGKTAFTKGIAVGLGIDQMIKSPTYTIVREYHQGRLPLYHMDVYRIEDGGLELGLEEYFEGDGVSIVEWGQQVQDELPASYLQIKLNYTEIQNERTIQFIPKGLRATELSDAIIKNMLGV